MQNSTLVLTDTHVSLKLTQNTFLPTAVDQCRQVVPSLGDILSVFSFETMLCFNNLGNALCKLFVSPQANTS